MQESARTPGPGPDRTQTSPAADAGTAAVGGGAAKRLRNLFGGPGPHPPARPSSPSSPSSSVINRLQGGPGGPNTVFFANILISHVLSGVERTGPTGGGPARVARRGRAGAGGRRPAAGAPARCGQSDDSEDEIGGNRRFVVHERSCRGLATAGTG